MQEVRREIQEESKRQEQEKAARGKRKKYRRNTKTWKKKACRNSKKLHPWLRRRFKGLGMQVGSQKAALGTRNSRPEAVSALQWGWCLGVAEVAF